MASVSSFPIIDVAAINDTRSHSRIAQEITQACQNWGFLLLRGHSIPAADIEELFSSGRSFFTLPEAEKTGYPITSKSIGYVGSFQDRGKDDKMSMWFGGTPGTLGANQDTLPPFWREYTDRIDAFKHKCHDLVIKLLECFALALDLPDPKFFAKAHSESVGNGNSLVMIMYPARTEMPIVEDLGSRMRPHTDSGSVTLLFQRAAGLEVESPAGDGWVEAPHIENCILVNLGDALSFWSGGQLKATLHRVTFDSLPYDQERQTMAYFGAANPDTVLQPILSSSNVGKYYSNGLELTPGITVGHLSQMIMRNIYGSTFDTMETTHKSTAKNDTITI